MVELLDRVLQMQSSGLSESDVSVQLRNEGVSPLDIANALNQARVKSAVSDASSPVSSEVIPDSSGSSVPDLPPASSSQMQNQPMTEQQPIPQEQQPVTQSVPDLPQVQNFSDQSSNPYASQSSPASPSQVQDQPMTEQQPIPQEQQPVTQQEQQQYYDPSQQQGYDQQAYAQQPQQAYDPNQQYADYYAQGSQGYDQNAYYDPNAGYGSVDTGLMSEVASQVFSDKFSEFVEKVGDLSSFRSSTEEKLKSLDRRLKKLEDSFDHLNRAVLGKVAEFGESSSLIHKDLDNLHDTVAKLMNPLADAFHEVKGHHARRKVVKKKSVKKKK